MRWLIQLEISSSAIVFFLKLVKCMLLFTTWLKSHYYPKCSGRYLDRNLHHKDQNRNVNMLTKYEFNIKLTYLKDFLNVMLKQIPPSFNLKNVY